uniref:Lipocalin n=1 Tax=Rhipicephalus appendiculatus TaxID=34631 RepID=A0A131YSR1_RHIAP
MLLTLAVAFFILGADAVSAMFKGANCQENTDGWAFMTGREPMYLTQRNFNTDLQNRNITECVSAETRNDDRVSHVIEQSITYHNKSSNQWITFQKNFTAGAWGYGSTAINFFSAVGPGGINMTYLVLTVEENCLVAKLLYRSNQKLRACEMWVRRSYFGGSASSDCCDRLYKSACDKTVQVLYDETECSQMEEIKNG